MDCKKKEYGYIFCILFGDTRMDIPLEISWQHILHDTLTHKTFIDMQAFLAKKIQQGSIIYPQKKDIFSALNLCLFSQVDVVILGQDPYHRPHQAHGLAFSIQQGPLPPSLKNIYTQIRNEGYIPKNTSGNLTHWAQQGVLLLNSFLTVEKGKPGSHAHIGWEYVTNQIIKKISTQKTGVIFVLWGKYAQQKKVYIDKEKHTILESSHPSPFSAYRGFYGCQHFTHINKIRNTQGKPPIIW